MNNEKYEIVKLVDNEFELDVNVSPKEDTVWLDTNQICILFSKSRSNILEHIKNIYDDKEQFKDSTCRKYRQVHFEGDRIVTRYINLYNLDMILSIGYRVKSARGNLFRKWSNSILKQYLLNGYTFNEKRCLSCQDNLLDLKERVSYIESKMKVRYKNE